MQFRTMEELREAMVQAAIIENARARKTWGNTNAATGTHLAKERGAKGGRPKENKPKPLTSQAKMVNRMLQTGLNCVEIGNILSRPADAIRTIKKNFDLPRDES
jgi:hypothetical protein